MTRARPSIGSRVSCSSVTIARNAWTPALPCAATTPSSAMRPQGVDDLGALAYQHIARAMLHQLTLLFGRFDPHEAHGRAPNRLADRLGVSGIVLVALDVGLHILRRHQAHLVAELRQLARPVMRRSTGLHADQARRQNSKILYHLAAPELPPSTHLLLDVDPVHLKHVLGEIKTD